MSQKFVAMRLLGTAVFVLAMPGWTMAQEPEHELVQRERAWVEATLTQNRQALWEILSDDFTVTGPQATRVGVGKEGWMLNALTLMRFGEVTLHDIEATAWGDVGVVRLHMTADWWIGERKLPTDFQLTDLWVRKDGRWQVVTRIAEDAPARE